MRHPTPKRASGNERPIKGGAGGIPPRLFASGLSLEKAWIPRPGPGGEPRRRSGPAMVPTQPPCQRQPGAAYPSGGQGAYRPWGAAPRGPRLPGGGPHFSREMGRKRAGALPLDPGFYSPLAVARSFWGSLSLIRSRGYSLRYPKTDLGRIFEKIWGKRIFQKKAPKSGHADGHRNSPTTGTMRHPTPKRASGNERAIKKGGPGGKAPGALSSGFLRGELQ